MPDDMTGDSGQIPTNMRLLLMLEAVVRNGSPMSPTDLCTEMGLPKPTVHRLLQTCEAEGFLQRDLDGRSYGPGRRLRRLSVATLSTQALRTARLAILNALADKVGETCNIAAPDREAMVYIDRIETKWPLRIQLPVGTHVPFYCTASGKMYLSSLKTDYLDRILRVAPLERRTSRTITDPGALGDEIALTRNRGYATDDEEFLEGMVAIAVPIWGRDGHVISTLSIHAPVLRYSLDELKYFVPQLERTAGDLSDLLSA